MTNTNYYFTVFWDNPDGTDWDESFDSSLAALNCYKRLKAPFKSLVITDPINGDRTLLTSTGDNNIDRYGLRYLFNLAGCMAGIEY